MPMIRTTQETGLREIKALRVECPCGAVTILPVEQVHHIIKCPCCDAPYPARCLRDWVLALHALNADDSPARVSIVVSE